jgi:hypothetical protein
VGGAKREGRRGGGWRPAEVVGWHDGGRRRIAGVISDGDADGSDWCCGLRWSPAAWRARWGGSDGCEAAGAGQVISRSLPDGHGLDRVDPAHREAGKRSIAGLGVGQRRGCRPAPGRSPWPTRSAKRRRRHAITAGASSGRGWWRSRGLSGGAGTKISTTAWARSSLSPSLAKPPSARCWPGRRPWRRPKRRSSALFCPSPSRCCRAPRRPLAGRSVAAIGHLHDSGLGIGGRRPRLLLGVQRLGDRQSFTDAAFAARRRPAPAGDSSSA